MNQQFVAQYGVETASIRSHEKNPHDDFYAIAKGTSTALGTLTMSPLGASIRLRIGVDGVRRLSRITRDPHKRHNVKEANITMEEGKIYFRRVLNSDNPFPGEPTEAMTFT